MAQAPRQAAATADFLAKELYVVFSTPVATREEIDKVLAEHLDYQVSLERQGVMFGAGPMFGPEGGPPRRGMIIIRAASFEDAERIAAEDPMHSRGVRSYEIERWILNEGTVTVRVNYSDQSMTIE